MADQFVPVIIRALDANGDPVALAQATWYEAGTTTPLTVYTDSALTTPHASPQVADANGVFAQVFIATGTTAKVDVVDPDTLASLPGFPLDNVPVTQAGGLSASGITFSATTTVPDTNVQGAIEQVDANITPSVSTKTGAYTVLVADRNRLLRCTSTLTLTLTAAATLGDGFKFAVKAEAGATVTIDPDGAETINGAATLVLQPGESAEIYTNGTLWSARAASLAALGVTATAAELNLLDGLTTVADEAYVDGLALGVGQTWQDVSGSRTAGTSYQNTTGRTITVAMEGRANIAYKVQVSSDGSTWMDIATTPDGDVGFAVYNVAIFPVPDTWYYKFNNASIGITSWLELR